jgi:hypothetical protein
LLWCRADVDADVVLMFISGGAYGVDTERVSVWLSVDF